jgi:hypothetical protein
VRVTESRAMNTRKQHSFLCVWHNAKFITSLRYTQDGIQLKCFGIATLQTLKSIHVIISTRHVNYVFAYYDTSTIHMILQQKNNKLRGLSPQANYTNRATAACRRS